MKKKTLQKKNYLWIDTVEEFNQVLKDAASMTSIIMCDYELRPKGFSLNEFSFLKDLKTTIEITTKFHEKRLIHHKDHHREVNWAPVTYMFKKEGSTSYYVDSSGVWASHQRGYKIPELNDQIERLGLQFGIPFPLNDKGGYVNSARGILAYKEYSGECYVYEYDMSSAYSWSYYNVMPDLNSPIELNCGRQIVNTEDKKYVGFMYDNEASMVLPEDGVPFTADIIFPIIRTPDPLRKYIEKWYAEKEDAKKCGDIKRKIIAKAHLTNVVGFSQRHNPFFRSWVVNRCNMRIRKYMGNEWVFINTDAIYSKVPLDVPMVQEDGSISENIGKFKLEYEGRFRWKGFNYQLLDKEETKLRGVPNKWVPKDYNILEDHTIESKNIYRYNQELNIMEEINYEV